MDIHVKDFTKTYGNQKAVDAISFEVKTGEILGFLGPNGAGKSTTMKAITSYIPIEAGKITVGTLDVSLQPELVKQHIGYLPENNPLYTDMPIIDYLKYVAALQNIPPAMQDEQIRKMIQICGLTDERHKKIGELSKGYRQRVGLAQALIHDPDILILDEPTTGLDPNQRVEIRNLIRNIGKEKTVILSSHILAEVEATCDRILIINKGKIVANGTAENLRKQAQGNQVLKVKVENSNINLVFEQLKAVDTIDAVDMLADGYFEVKSKNETTSNKGIFEMCVQNNWILSELTPLQTNLEDVFRDLTQIIRE